MRVPFLRPTPPRLSKLPEALSAIEESGIYTNYGPVNSAFETNVVKSLFAGSGSCVTVCNATIGLMSTIAAVTNATDPASNSGYALIPSFTFAATAQAAIWTGLRPIFYDIDPDTWLPSKAQEEALLEKYGSEIRVVIPYATFGRGLDIAHYENLRNRFSVPVVVDAAASLGGRDRHGRQVGYGSDIPFVYSLHATKTFSTAEGGLIYSADAALIHQIRIMGNFGFEKPRNSSMLGLNSKMPEVIALLAQERLNVLPAVVASRQRVAEAYKNGINDLTFQNEEGDQVAYQFFPALVPESLSSKRDIIVDKLAQMGVGVAKYFSPHLYEQPYFQEFSLETELQFTNSVSSRIISLPIYDQITEIEVKYIIDCINQVISELREERH
ncbi:DegT/DnrJ/EryC1/StrS family aminotransferase [Aureimonas frigidaquae]|uniref:DegT/DnrJ/EryC1/StrS aminotransferase n=1 Tax=Aureimonas frigidaquae TaxID=424757 RepID=A0A0P0Z1Z6_9HYPH|nr:DegT/DnrJ/EryC1/StrS aminotransferase family protein [Aureimonas frigidaquae]BAT28002.1 hypothetical protein [Aureimonas frigidaquae]